MVRVSRQPWECTSRSAAPHSRSGGSGRTRSRRSTRCASRRLRPRPQYMMIGEVRGPEAFVVFQAMATGKSAYTTFHADDVQAMVHRLENDPINLPRALVAALDIVLLQAQVKVGTDMTRRVKAIVEVVGTDPESNELITNSAYTWNPADDTFNYSGHSYVYEKISLARNWNQRRMEQEQDRIRIPCEEPSGQRRPERSDAEDTQERKAEGQPAKRPRHFSGDERVL